MSHHLDSLTAKSDPRLDISDFYVFPGSAGTAFVLNANPGGTNGFHPEADYEVKIDLDGDNREDLTLCVTFDGRDWRGRQEATLTLRTGPDAADHTAAGNILARTKTGKKSTGDGGIRFWAGRAGDPFYIDATVVTAVGEAVTRGSRLDLGGFDPDEAKNRFAGSSVQAIVIEIPDSFFHGLRIGCWGAISVPNDAGTTWRQTDRAAVPLTSTLFGFSSNDDYNATQPADDADIWAPKIERMIARAVKANGYYGDAAAYAAELRPHLSPEILHYRIGSAASFTDRRFNGRNLTEDVASDMFAHVLGRPVTMGLDASSTAPASVEFPYLGET